MKQRRRELVRAHLPEIVDRLNAYLRGENLSVIRPILNRLGRNGAMPHWFDGLVKSSTLPNLDGKTVGSVVEMLFVADIEHNVLTGALATELKINPASGVDVPDLDLGIKSPSENWCTSEPFTHAYERILGSEYDVVALITNYQTAKASPPLRLQIIAGEYLSSYQVADKGLCERARLLRDNIAAIGETSAKKVFRFLAYANQSEWMCKRLMQAVAHLADEHAMIATLRAAVADYDKDIRRLRRPINPQYPEKIKQIIEARPLHMGLINAVDDWVIESWRNTAQIPTHSDWERFQRSPLEGRLGVSFALQWRYNFGILFNREG